jgi:hypothetical protein
MVAAEFLTRFDVTKGSPCGTQGLVFVHAGGPVQLDLLLQVITKFVFEILFDFPATKQRPKQQR